MSAVDRAAEVIARCRHARNNPMTSRDMAQALADAGLLPTEADVCPHVVSSDDGTSYCGLAASRTEQDDINAAIAGRVRVQAEAARLVGSSHEDWLVTLDYLLNGGEA